MKDNPDLGGTLDRALELMIAIASTGRRIAVAEQASALGIPLSSAYRIISTLVRYGLLAKGRRGHFGPGLALEGLGAAAEPLGILAAAARPPLRRLARTLRATAHLGVIENEMVTYLVKEEGGGRPVFTRQLGQLEAYCSAIGKVLLGTFEDRRLAEYLDAGPFIALTNHTVTDRHAIYAEIKQVLRDGFAVDDRAVADDLVCIAAPVRDHTGRTVAAISLSRYVDSAFAPEPVPELFACVLTIERRLGMRA